MLGKQEGIINKSRVITRRGRKSAYYVTILVGEVTENKRRPGEIEWGGIILTNLEDGEGSIIFYANLQ